MKTRIHRLLAVPLLFLLLLGACAPAAESGDGSSSSQPEQAVSSAAPSLPARQDDGRFVLPYNATDSLHPYRSSTDLNTALHTLVYDSLVRLDNDFTPVMSIASDISIDGVTCTVTLKSGLRFSDGTPLTALDVRYSIDCIRASSSVYAGRLANVQSYAAQDDRTLVFTLAMPDSLFINLLDFPVIQNGSNQQERPAGSGRYRYVQDIDTADGTVRLDANEQWYGGSVDNFQTLWLAPFDYKQSLIYTLKSGAIDFAFTDLAQVQSSTNMGSSPIQVPLSNLVYLGVNNTSGVTATASFRKAISLCLDRSAIVSEAFLSRASAASAPFNPNMYATKDLEVQLAADSAAADAMLDALGYTQRDADGYRLHGAQRLTLTVLVNTDSFYRTQTARVVQQNLAAVGIDCVINELSPDDYRAAVTNGQFELYIGEVRLHANNDLSPFFTAGGALAYGGVSADPAASAYYALRRGESGYQSFCSLFAEQSPFIPLVFRNGVSCFARTMAYNVKSSMSDPFFNIEDWSYAQ